MLCQAYSTVEGVNVMLYGDPKQCSPAEGGSQVNYDYTNSVAVREKCAEVVEMEYIHETGRYDMQGAKQHIKHIPIS